jgi:hypothetical protein
MLGWDGIELYLLGSRVIMAIIPCINDTRRFVEVAEKLRKQDVYKHSVAYGDKLNALISNELDSLVNTEQGHVFFGKA